MSKPKLTIDTTCDAAYLRLSKKKVYETNMMSNGIIVDYDRRGWLVGIEFLNTSILRELLNEMEVGLNSGSGTEKD